MTNIASNIITKLGGHQRAADMLGLDVSRIYRWTYPKNRGGTGGIVPTKHQQTIINEAGKLGIELTPNDFFDIPHKTKISKLN